MFRFADPYALLLLALIPGAVWYAARRLRKPALATSRAAAGSGAPVSPMLVINRLLPVLPYLALVLMIAALARPQWGTRKMQMDTLGVNIALAVDLSESMAALDFKQNGQIINRLAAAKTVIRDFIAKRGGDRIGMVVFGDQAYTQLPLTRDYGAIAAILERLEIGAAGRSTAIGDAIGICLKRLRDIESTSNVIILLTDGRSNSGELDPAEAADIARRQRVKIYAVGIGDRGRAPFLVNDPVFGQRYVYQRVDLDEETLKTLADTTGGLYFRATDLEGLREIYDTIDSLEKTDVEVTVYANYKDLYLYPLLGALGLLALWAVLKNTRFLEIP